MLTHPKSPLRVLRMLVQLCLGHVILLLGEFTPFPRIFSPIGLMTVHRCCMFPFALAGPYLFIKTSLRANNLQGI